MRVSRAGKVAAVVLLLAAAAGLAAVYTRSSREVTTSSDEAYKAWREAIENERRFYMKEARLGFARALQLDPQFAMAMIGLARNSDREQLIALTRRAGRERGRLTEHERLHVELMEAAIDHADDRFLAIARQIHDKYPSDIRAAGILARKEIESGRFDSALKIFSDVLAIDPNNADAYNQIGYSYGWRGDYEKAIVNLKKYQFMAPAQANPYDSLGEIQAYSGHYDEAIENLNRALALKPDFYQSYMNQGVAYEGKGDVGKAIESYAKASKEAVTDGGRIENLLRAFRVAALSGDVPRARELVQQLAAMPHDKSFDAMFEVGRDFVHAVLLAQEGKPADAERLLLALKPKWNEAFLKNNKNTTYKPYWPFWDLMLARTRAAQGKTDEAIAVYEEMVNPPNPWGDFESRRWVYEGRAALAELVARKGDLERADRLLAENHKWNPSWAPSRTAELAVAEMHRERVQAASK
jgi:tetratricopeptide (TPR) repeat protein